MKRKLNTIQTIKTIINNTALKDSQKLELIKCIMKDLEIKEQK